jgi:hypothetical protein
MVTRVSSGEGGSRGMRMGAGQDGVLMTIGGQGQGRREASTVTKRKGITVRMRGDETLVGLVVPSRGASKQGQ